MELKNTVAIITGASSGIGRAVAFDLNNAGVRLALNARREDRLQALADELGGAVVVPGDITDPEMPHRLLDAAIEEYGRCDIVINNAGILHMGTIEEIEIDKVCRMVRINVEAAFRMAYIAMKHFKREGHGYLINVSSILGTKVRPTAGPYAATKYAIEALTEALRMEVAQTKIGVACIEPGLVLTELHSEWEVHPTESLNIPRPLSPEDIARGVRFILEQPSHVRVPRMLMVPTDQNI